MRTTENWLVKKVTAEAMYYDGEDGGVIDNHPQNWDTTIERWDESPYQCFQTALRRVCARFNVTYNKNNVCGVSSEPSEKYAHYATITMTFAVDKDGKEINGAPQTGDFILHINADFQKIILRSPTKSEILNAIENGDEPSEWGYWKTTF